MVLADYPLLEAIWTISIIFLWALWIFTVIWALVDNFRRKDNGGWSKALWLFFIIFLPIIGVMSYYIARPVDAGYA